MTHEQCMSRAQRVLSSSGYSVKPLYHRAWVGDMDSFTAHITCYSIRENEEMVTVTVAGYPGHDVNREGKRVDDAMWQGTAAAQPPSTATTSTGSCTFNYKGWDGSSWSARIEGAGFVHAPNGDWSRAHRDTIIRYISWDDNRWTAKITGSQFSHAPSEDWNRAHDDVILNYYDWTGNRGTFKLGDCRHN